VLTVLGTRFIHSELPFLRHNAAGSEFLPSDEIVFCLREKSLREAVQLQKN